MRAKDAEELLGTNTSELSDGDLDQHIADLAALRTRVREAQNDAQAQKDARAALSSMSPAAQRIVLHGGLVPAGERS